MYRFNSFTQKANDVLNLAIKAAENFGHTYILSIINISEPTRPS